ncbi:DUF4492 domain-containing protein [Malaciobacter marinus]|uniref:DUF4492 domain-containing protein n=1 Tax=Malaciobacter marinus TaxID=505249 RepID=A0A1T4ZRI2_9BACT|nr:MULTISPECIES: DUF4492 domain-containing protein [Malaciobacter]AXX87894.1 DUF4492 domain-containing protein [Malaciobacter marinus]PHO11470.1 DUF4492 domain-containing protein [Malaciobacter marinus]PHO15401.1 DUF4492 domain-containing protein [Malaciobacter marinus]PPK57486.1 uncharacterized protein DUF4492 [Malaciobacter marinus]RYA24713.1 DUF4492 domain-containing protein [Malaciobacter halophilus]
MNYLKSIYNLYYDGFRNLTVGKSLWKIVIIKLITILVILNIFVYDKSFKSEYKTEKQKQNFVFKNMTKGD